MRPSVKPVTRANRFADMNPRPKRRDGHQNSVPQPLAEGCEATRLPRVESEGSSLPGGREQSAGQP